MSAADNIASRLSRLPISKVGTRKEIGSVKNETKYLFSHVLSIFYLRQYMKYMVSQFEEKNIPVQWFSGIELN